MNEGTGGDIGQRQSVAGLDIRRGAGDYCVAHLQAVGGDDISFLAVLIFDQGDESGTVRIVFQGLDRSRYVKLLTFEIDDAIFSTVSAASVADGDSAVAVTSGLLVQGSQQAFFRGYLGKAGVIRNRHIAPGGRSRLIIDDRHYGFTLLMMALRGFA